MSERGAVQLAYLIFSHVVNFFVYKYIVEICCFSIRPALIINTFCIFFIMLCCLQLTDFLSWCLGTKRLSSLILYVTRCVWLVNLITTVFSIVEFYGCQEFWYNSLQVDHNLVL